MIASLMLMGLLAGCCCVKSSVCPEFPTPDPAVAERLDALSAIDASVREWGNDLLRLKEKLDNCNGR